MKLKEFLNQVYDETWVSIKVSKDKKFDLWMADYIGWYEPVMKDIEPYLDRDIIDEVYTTIKEDPENEGDEAAFICVELRSARDSKRRADSEILEDIIVAVKEYDTLLGNERHFDDDADTKKRLLKDISSARKAINKLIIEAKGDTNNTL